jgi:hypothetical protein
LIGRGQDVDIGPLSASVECRAVLVVVVSNQEAWPLPIWGRFAQLLSLCWLLNPSIAV